MNENLDLVSILRSAEKGTVLYSPLFGDVELDHVVEHDQEYYIFVNTSRDGDFSDDRQVSFLRDGRYYGYPGSECLLFPSRDQRDWSKFHVARKRVKVTIHPLDPVLVRDFEEGPDTDPWCLEFFAGKLDDCYLSTAGTGWDFMIPYTKATYHLKGTEDACPIDYDFEFASEPRVDVYEINSK